MGLLKHPASSIRLREQATAMKIAVNTGGGDAPGLNAVIRAVALSALQRGVEVWGIRHGYRGLLESREHGLIRLDRDAVRGITHLGGTILGSTNRGDPYRFPVEKNGEMVPTDVSADIVRRFKEEGFEALIAIGGDGSLKLATKLMGAGIPRVIGVPKTIDNDIIGTDLTFGFETAVATATDAIDKLHSTAQAHERVMVVEVMGRHAGWIALHSGISGSADAILIPEIPFSLEPVCEKIEARQRRGRAFSIVVVAEGAVPLGGSALYKQAEEKFKEHAQLGGVAEQVAAEIARISGKETRSLVLGHLQRGGGPSTSDRLLALRLGCGATHFAWEAKHSGMIALRSGDIRVVPLEEVTQGTRSVPLDHGILQTGRDLGMSFGDESPGHFLGSLVPPPPKPTGP
jgi:ATP-dependent phosphofructokinase / diphosphate-dependent phosphofructokinase